MACYHEGQSNQRLREIALVCVFMICIVMCSALGRKVIEEFPNSFSNKTETAWLSDYVVSYCALVTRYSSD